MTTSAAQLADRLEADLRALGTPERAASQKTYLKSDLEFFGCTLGQTRATVRTLVAEGPLDHDGVVALAAELWRKPINDRRMAAVILLEGSPKLLGVADLAFLEGLIRDSSTWAYVDSLAGGAAGRIVLADPVGAEPVLDSWATDGDFWVRRSALLALLAPLKKAAHPEPFFAQFSRYADPLLEEKEFFIRKAIGWVLREVSKQRPDLVVAWLGPRTHRASGVTVRDAVKYLPEGDRERLLVAYRESRLPAAASGKKVNGSTVSC